MVENLPANASDAGPIPGSGRFNKPVHHNYCTWALEPMLQNITNHLNEKPSGHN